ncbi:hypothetical protein [Actinomadura yumaensis]|uniref:Uncharacterized protein n=1 Tax=Actinomadura yumaensis TaxID=111807 RepID=A0ABW2CQB7_9ACTN
MYDDPSCAYAEGYADAMSGDLDVRLDRQYPAYAAGAVAARRDAAAGTPAAHRLPAVCGRCGAVLEPGRPRVLADCVDVGGSVNCRAGGMHVADR